MKRAQKFSADRTCSSRDMLAARQTTAQTGTQTDMRSAYILPRSATRAAEVQYEMSSDDDDGTIMD